MRPDWVTDLKTVFKFCQVQPSTGSAEARARSTIRPGVQFCRWPRARASPVCRRPTVLSEYRYCCLFMSSFRSSLPPG
eukprot:762409-Hanusia_phi.AAC.4